MADAMKTDKMRLSDLVHRWTFMDKVDKVPIQEPALAVQRVYRSKLRAAQRFIVNDASVKLTCHLSHEEDRLEGWSFLARLPYDVIWFELSLHTKVKEFENMNKLRLPFKPAEVAKNIGYLMFKDSSDPTNPRWVCHAFLQMADDQVTPDMMSYVFHPEGDPKFPTRGSDFWRAPTLSLIPGFPKIPVSVAVDSPMFEAIKAPCDPELLLGGLMKQKPGSHFVHLEKDGTVITDEDLIQGPEWLMPRMAAIVDPWWEAHLRERYKDQNERWMRVVASQVMENAGHLRWIITLLAAINGVPKTTKLRPPSEGKHSLGMYQMPYFSHSDLDLTIPAEDRVLYARKQLDKVSNSNHARRRWHTVRGHWRVVEQGKRLYICRHDPTMVEKGLGMCTKCQLMIRWIEVPHGRGDATLGVVDHVYQVKT